MTSSLQIPCFKALERAFTEFCAARDYQEQPSLLVTDVSLDKSTRFVGSVTTVFKPYYNEVRVRSNSFWLIQDCLKTFNLNKLKVIRSSYYPAFGMHVPIYRAGQILSDLFELLTDSFGIPATHIEAHVSSQDADLVKGVGLAILSRGGVRMRTDELEPDRYAHGFGTNTITGRNLVIFLNQLSGSVKRKFVATAVVISIDGIEAFLEITIKPLAIVQYIEKKNSEFDIYPSLSDVFDFSSEFCNRLHDSIIASCLIEKSQSSLTKSSNQYRLFLKYKKNVSDYLIENRIDFSVDEIMRKYGREVF